MAVKDVTVSLKVAGGTWETLGADRARGIWPENVEINADRWGPKTASFDLRRDPDVTWPDLQPFTPVDIEIDGRKRWSGRIAQTPTRDSLDSVINVQCEGWQAHLDDDMYERVYVHTNLSDWKDMRSEPAAELGQDRLYAGGQVSADGGIALTFPNGTTVSTGAHVGVTLDMGPNSTAKRVVLTWQTASGIPASVFKLFCRGLDAPGGATTATSYSDAFQIVAGGTNPTSGTTSGTLSTARRYLYIFVYFDGTTSVASADRWFKLLNIQVFSDATHESGGGSVLKAHQVVTDALDRGTLLLSSDRSKIDTAATWFSIPEFAPSGPRTPRQAWEAVDVFEDRTKKIDAERRPVYKERPATAEVEVGQWSAMAFEDASAGDGGDIYNRVIAAAEQPDSTPLRVSRAQAQQSGVMQEPLASAVSNGGFESNTSGWTAGISTITRDTSVKLSGTASGRWDYTGASDNVPGGSYLICNLSGTFFAGVAYTLMFYIRSSGSGAYLYCVFGDGASADRVTTGASLSTAGTWYPVTMSWTPLVTHASTVQLYLSPSTSSSYYHLDEVSIATAQPTIVDKQRFLRTKTLDVGFKLTSSAATQIADKWLAAHKRTPFKGRLTLQGPGSVRHVLTGRPVPLDELLERTDEFLRFNDRVDPDTGAQGRDGRIVEVSYKPATDEAVVTIDSSRARFEALLERLGLVVGQFRSPG